MNKKLFGGVVISLSLVVMLIGVGIVYFLNSTGVTILQNFKIENIRTQLVNNINSGLAIATDSALPEFDNRNEITIQTVEDGTIKILRRPVYTARLWGQNEYVGVVDNPVLQMSQSFSISLWFYPQTDRVNKPFNGEALFVHGDLGSGEEDFGYDALFIHRNESTEAVLQFRLAIIDAEGNHSTVAIRSNNIFDNAWYHLVVTFDQANLKMYINGELVSTSAAAGSVDWTDYPGFGQTKRIFIGKRSANHSNRLFEGQVRNFGLWDTALTTNAIRSITSRGLGFNPLYSIGDYGAVGNVIAYLKMNENKGIRLHDLSTNKIGAFINVNFRGGPLAVWVAVTDSFSTYIQSEYKGHERIEPFR